MRQRLPLLIFITTVIVMAQMYFIVPSCLDYRKTCLGEPNAPVTAPALYRVLPNVLMNAIAPNARPFTVDTLWTVLMLQTVAIIGTIPALYLWLKRWCDPDRAVVGVVLFSVLYVMAFHYWFTSLGSALEILFVCWALVLLDRNWLLLIPLVILASLNRETGLVIAAIYGAYYWRKGFKPSLVLFAIWAGITLGLHLILGAAPHSVGGLAGTLAYNLANLSDGIFANLLLIPLAIMLLTNYRYAPAPIKRLAWVALVYMLAIAVGGAWGEVQRLILPILPLLLPLALSSQPSAKLGLL